LHIEERIGEKIGFQVKIFKKIASGIKIWFNFAFQSTFSMKNPETELKEIRQIMERSTRFISLSGLSGIMAGIYGLVAAALAYFWIYYPNLPFGYRSIYVSDPAIVIKLVITALIALALSFATAFFLSYKNAHK